MRKFILAIILLLGQQVYGQGVKMSAFDIAPVVDTGHMKFVVVYNAGGAYLNKQVSMGMFARYLSNTYSAALSPGYGLGYSGMTFKLDSTIVFPQLLGTLAAGYGLNYSGRTFRADTGAMFARLGNTFTSGYGLNYSSRTYTADTGLLFPKAVSTLAAGYGLSYSSRTFKIDTNLVTSKESRKKGLDSLYAQMASQNTYSVSYTSSATVTSTVASEMSIVNYDISAQASDLLFNNPTGSWANHQILIIRIKDNGTLRNLTYGTKFRGGGLSLLPQTEPGKLWKQEFERNSTDDKWDLVGQCYNQ